MKRVMIVDDAIYMRKALKKILEKNGFSVVAEAENGVEAVDRYKALNPDIVALDMMMPVVDGLETIRRIMKLDNQAVIVAITPIGLENTVREAVQIGAKNFILKPFQEDIVMSVFRRL